MTRRHRVRVKLCFRTRKTFPNYNEAYHYFVPWYIIDLTTKHLSKKRYITIANIVIIACLWSQTFRKNLCLRLIYILYMYIYIYFFFLIVDSLSKGCILFKPWTDTYIHKQRTCDVLNSFYEDFLSFSLSFMYVHRTISNTEITATTTCCFHLNSTL